VYPPRGVAPGASAGATVNAYRRCDRSGKAGAVLPSLIRDFDTSIAAGRDVAELLDLAGVVNLPGLPGGPTPPRNSRDQ
jgi:hypothetical protein